MLSLKNVRYIDPRACDRMTELIANTGVPDTEKHDEVIKLIHQLSKVKPESAKEKLTLFLTKLEKNIVKDRYNLIIKGIPDKAEVSATGETEVIGYTHMRDTIKQFGAFSKMHLIRGTLYVQFRRETSCVHCHSLLNNMQMGTNIISTQIV